MKDHHEVYVKLIVNDDGSVALTKVGKAAEKADQGMGKLDKAIIGVSARAKTFVAGALGPMVAIMSGAAAVAGVMRLTNGFMEMAKSVDQMKVRLKVLLGDVGESNKLFEDLATYAGRVPFELQEVMQSATTLAGIMKGGRTEIMKWMPLVGDLAAAVGLSIEETTEQVMRMLSAGAASADRFRERGVLAMLGFQAGVSYSAEQTAQKLWDAWNSSTSKFKGATDDLAKTWSGTMSMFGDAWFQFNRAIADAGAWDTMREAAEDLLGKVYELQKSGKLDEWARDISSSIEDAVGSVRTIAGALEDVYGLLRAIRDFGKLDVGGFLQADLFRSPMGLPGGLSLTPEMYAKANQAGDKMVDHFIESWNEGVKKRTGLGIQEYILSEFQRMGWEGGEKFAGAFDKYLGTEWRGKLPKDLGPREPWSRVASPYQAPAQAGPFDYYAAYEKMKKDKYYMLGEEQKEWTEAKEKLLELEVEHLEKVWDAQKDASEKKKKKDDEDIKAQLKAKQEYYKAAKDMDDEFNQMMLEVRDEIVQSREGEIALEVDQLQRVRDERIKMLDFMVMTEVEYIAHLMKIWEAYYLEVGAMAQQRSEQMKKDNEESLIRMKELAEGTGDTIASSIGDMAMSATSSFNDMGTAFTGMITGMLRDIARLTMQKTLLEPLSNVIGGALGGLFGGAGFQCPGMPALLVHCFPELH